MADNLRKFTTQEVLNKVYSDSSGNSIGINAATSKETLNAALDTTNSRLNVSLAGGTIGGDVTINGDLIVNGTAGNAYDEIVNGDLHIKSDISNSTNAFLVEKNDGTDVFIVDTTNSRVGINSTPSRTFQVDGTASATTATGYFYTNAIHTGVDTQSVVSIRSDNASSTGNVLHVQGDGTGNLLTLNKDGSDKLTVTHEGKVGIGHDLTAHSQKLVVKRNASATTLIAGAMVNLVNEQGAGNTATLRFTGVNQNAYLGYFDGSSTSSQKLAIGVGSGGSGNGQVTITGEGNVGIGLTNPGARLEVKGANGSNSTENTTLTDSSGNHLFTQLNGGKAYFQYGPVGIGTTSPSGILSIFRNDSSTVGTNDVVIENDGNGDASLKFSLTGATDWYAYVDNSDSDKFKIRRSTTDHLSIDESGNATFAGDVTVSKSGNAFLNLTSTGGGARIKLTGQANETTNGLLFYEASNQRGQINYNHSDQKMEFKTGDSTTLALTIDSSQNSTFSGNVTSNGNILSQGASAPSISVLDTTNNASIQMRAVDTEVRFGSTSNHPVKIGTNDSYDVIVLGTDKSATFGGDVKIQGSDTAGIIDSLTLVNPRNSSSTGDGTQINFQNTTTSARSAFIKGMSTGTYGQSNELIFGTSVGTNAPTESIRINSDKSLSFSQSAGTSATTASIVHGSNNYLYIRGGVSGLVIGDNTVNSRMQINNDAEIKFEIAGSERMRLDTDSRISLSNNDGGNLANTIFGKNAFNTSTDNGSDYNVAIGELAMGTGTVAGAQKNIAIGWSALTDITSGDDNIAIGRTAGANITTANKTVFIGLSAGFAVTTTGGVDGTVGIGYNTLSALTSGASNTAVGYQAGNTLTTGGNNTVIGTDADTSASGSTNQIVIGATATGVADNSVTLGNASITDVYMSQDSGANIHCADIYAYNQITIESADISNGENNGLKLVNTSGVDQVWHITNGQTGVSNENFTIRDSTNNRDIVVLETSSGNATFYNRIILGGGITFPASQNASSNANTLDDYEEGDWTITDTSGAGLSLTVLSNKYIKVGRQVTATANVTFPTTSDTTVVSLSLPFTASSTGSVSGGAVLEQNISVSNHYTACVDGANVLKFRLRGVTSQTYANLSGKRFKFIITYHTVD